MTLPIIEMTEDEERAWKKDRTKTREIPSGGYCEFPGWAIVENSIEYCTPADACKHATAIARVTHTTYPDKSKFTMEYVVVPRVVQAFNEGGCNSTTVCVDCILDAIK